MTNPTQKALDEAKTALNEPDYALHLLRTLVDDYGHVFVEYEVGEYLQMAVTVMEIKMKEVKK